MVTRVLHIEQTTDDVLLTAATYQATGLLHKIYNKLELAEDGGFIAQMEGIYPLMDASWYESTFANAKAMYSSLEAIRGDKEDELLYITKRLEEDEFSTMYEKREKFFLEKKQREIIRTKNKNITFGGKQTLRAITAAKQRIQNKNKELHDALSVKPRGARERIEKQCNVKELKREIRKTQVSLAKYEEEFRKNRVSGLYIIGRACEGGNRKVDFDLLNNKILLKLNKNNHIEITLVPLRGKKLKRELIELQKAIENDAIAVTVRITTEDVYLSFDEQKLAGYAFDAIGCKNKIKELGLKKDDKDKKKVVYKEFFQEQEERFYKDKLAYRYAAIDKNPYEISLVIGDKLNNEGKFHVVFEWVFDLVELAKKLGLSSDDPKQLRQNNKMKTEIANLWSHIFDLMIHYRVGNFVHEDLELKPKTSAEKQAKEFNRQTKHIWHRTLSDQLLTKHTNKLGIKLIGVEPCYSSFIGNLIFMKYDPIAAAYELMRRGIVKFIKGRSFFPDTSRICLEKMDYLKSKNIEINSWVQLFKKTTKAGLRYRNRDKKLFLCQEHHLNSRKSKIKTLTPV